jgi:hypothetical protein
MSFKAKIDYVLLFVLLRVLRSQTFIEPLLEPTMTCSSDWVKVSAVSDETLLFICGLRTAIGFSEEML